jgi:hypothetical protein
MLVALCCSGPCTPPRLSWSDASPLVDRWRRAIPSTEQSRHLSLPFYLLTQRDIRDALERLRAGGAVGCLIAQYYTSHGRG